MFFQQNADSLGVRGLNACQQLQHTPLTSDVEPFVTDDGVLTLRYRNLWLHHPQHPAKEAEAAVASLPPSGAKHRVYVVVGMGLGYLPQCLLNTLQQSQQSITGQTAATQQSQVVIYEPFADILRFVLEHVNLTPLLANPSVSMFTEFLPLLQHLRQLTKTSPGYQVEVLMLPAYGQLLGETTYQHLARQIYEMEGESKIRQQAHYANAQTWLTHTLANTPALQGLYPLEALKSQYCHIPALVIQHYPGLSEQLPLLSTLQNKVILIVLPCAVPMLQQAGIAPDLVVVWDTTPPIHEGDWQALHVVLPVWAHPDWFTLPVQGRWVASSQDTPALHHWLEQCYADPLDALPAMRSALVLGCYMAAWLGCHALLVMGAEAWENPLAPAMEVAGYAGLGHLASGHNSGRHHGSPTRFQVSAATYDTLRELGHFADTLPPSMERLISVNPHSIALPGFTATGLEQALNWANLPVVYKALYPLRRPFPLGMGDKMLREGLRAMARGIRLLTDLLGEVYTEDAIAEHKPDSMSRYRQLRSAWESLWAEHPLLRFELSLPSYLQPSPLHASNAQHVPAHQIIRLDLPAQQVVPLLEQALEVLHNRYVQWSELLVAAAPQSQLQPQSQPQHLQQNLYDPNFYDQNPDDQHVDLLAEFAPAQLPATGTNATGDAPVYTPAELLRLVNSPTDPTDATVLNADPSSPLSQGTTPVVVPVITPLAEVLMTHRPDWVVVFDDCPGMGLYVEWLIDMIGHGRLLYVLTPGNSNAAGLRLAVDNAADNTATPEQLTSSSTLPLKKMQAMLPVLKRGRYAHTGVHGGVHGSGQADNPSTSNTGASNTSANNSAKALHAQLAMLPKDGKVLWCYGRAPEALSQLPPEVNQVLPTSPVWQGQTDRWTLVLSDASKSAFAA
jgi:hypothetical protein